MAKQYTWINTTGRVQLASWFDSYERAELQAQQAGHDLPELAVIEFEHDDKSGITTMCAPVWYGGTSQRCEMVVSHVGRDVALKMFAAAIKAHEREVA